MGFVFASNLVHCALPLYISFAQSPLTYVNPNVQSRRRKFSYWQTKLGIDNLLSCPYMVFLKKENVDENEEDNLLNFGMDFYFHLYIKTVCGFTFSIAKTILVMQDIYLFVSCRNLLNFHFLMNVTTQNTLWLSLEFCFFESCILLNKTAQYGNK